MIHPASSSGPPPDALRAEWDSVLAQLASAHAPQGRGGKNAAPSLAPVQRGLDVLSDIPWPHPAIQKEDGAAMLAALSNFSKSSPQLLDPFLGSRLCAFISKLSDKQQVSFTPAQLDTVVQLLLILIGGHNFSLSLDALRALSYVLFENGGKTRLFEQLRDVLLPRCRLVPGAGAVERELQRFAIHCTGNMVIKTGPKLAPHHDVIFEALYRNLLQCVDGAKHEPALAKILSATLRALQLLVSESNASKAASIPRSLHLHFNELLGVLRALVFFGTPLNPLSAHHDPQPSKPRKIGGLSDSDGSTDDAKDEGGEVAGWKVRLNALNCVQAIAKSNAKLFHNHWSSFLPSSSASGPPRATTLASASLFTAVQLDPTPKVRMACLSALITILDGSRPYWLAADETALKKGPPQTFVPYSATLVSMVREIHAGLWLVLDTELSMPCLCLALKALALLAANAPYEKLGPNLVGGILQRLVGPAGPPKQPLVEHANTSVRVCALGCLSSLLLTRTPLGEMEAALKDPKLALVERLLALCCDPQPPQVRAESLACVAALAKHYFPSLAPHWSPTLLNTALLPPLLHHSDPQVRSAAARVIEEFTGAAAVPTAQYLEAQLLALWNAILESQWTKALEDSSHPVRCSVCTTFSNLTGPVFALLPKNSQVTLLTLTLSSAASDGVASVRAAACKTLGTFILFPCLREDLLFLSDAALQLLKSMEDQNLNVRVRAVWSLANLCDGLVIEKEAAPTAQRNFEEDLSPELMAGILQACLRAATDQDKIRCNAVRALGNFARFSSPQFLLPHVNQIVALLIQNLTHGSPKVRWNSCYALGNLLRNLSLLAASAAASKSASPPWLTSVLDALTDVVRDCKNFKIRINAALSLACLPRRGLYPSACFLRLWEGVLSSLRTIDRVTDFSEYQYKQTLTNQLLATLLHLVTLTDITTDKDLLGTLLLAEKDFVVAFLDGEEARKHAPPRSAPHWPLLQSIYLALGSPLPPPPPATAP